MLLFASLGFSLPLLVVVGIEFLWGLILLAPSPLNKPGIRLAQLTYTRTGSTVVYSLISMLVLLLVSPIYDTMRIAQAASIADSTASNVGAAQLQAAAMSVQTQSIATDEGLQARTELSLLLNLTAAIFLHFLRRFGDALAQCERLLEQAAKVTGSKGEVGVVDTRKKEEGVGKSVLKKEA